MTRMLQKTRILSSGCLLLALLCMTTDAQAVNLGARVGGVYSHLGRPTDPAGEPTLLYGSIFSGTGLMFGAHANSLIADLSGNALSLSIELLYGMHSAQGFAQQEDQKKTIDLSAHIVHVPLLVLYTHNLGDIPVEPRVAFGPQLLVGTFTGSTVTQENIPGTVQPLETTATMHLGFTGMLGASIKVGSISIPLELRATFDPFVPGSTKDRFRNYVSPDQPGLFQVAFNWNVQFLAGVDFSL